MGKRRKTSGRSKKEANDNAVVSSSQNFVVEKIIDSCVDVNNKQWYKLKWLGFPDDQATWEPKCNLDCTGLIKEYEKHKQALANKEAAQWSLKQPKGTSTKIVLKKVNLVSSEENCNEIPKPIVSGGIKVNKECTTSSDEDSLVTKKPGKSTKIVIKKSNLGSVPKQELPSKNANNETILGNCHLNGSAKEMSSNLPKRQSKRRRSSTIGKQVSVSKKKKTQCRSNVESVTVPLSQDDEEYTVEAIIDKCLDASGKILYLIKWVGYDSIYNTWEPIEHLNCVELLHEFNTKYKQPKVIVSKILDKKQIGDQVEYLVKISGCRKEKWMNESDMKCPELLTEFNKVYDLEHSQKFSLADIADDCSSSSEEENEESPKPLVSQGIKMNRECTTSSDEDSFSPIHKKNKKKDITNGRTICRTHERSNSSSSSNIDFEDLLNQYNESVKKEKSTTPTTPSDMDPTSSPNKTENAKSMSPQNTVPLDPLANIKLADYKLPTLVIPKEEKYKPLPKQEIKCKTERSPTIELKFRCESPKQKQDNFKLEVSVASNFVFNSEPNCFKSETEFKYNPLTACSYEKPHFTPQVSTIASELKSQFPITKDPKEDPDIKDFDDNASNASTESSDSFSSIEKDLTEALESEEATAVIKTENPLPPEPQTSKNITHNQSFSGVDLGALILEPDKSLNVSEGGLLDVIVNQTVQQIANIDSLNAAFLETSVTENNQSHSELFAVVAEHTEQPDPEPPSEKEIDSVLDQIFVSTVSNELKISPGKQSIKSESTDVNSLDDIITNLDNMTRSESPNPSTSSCPQSPIPPPVSPPFKSFMSTFTSQNKSHKSAPKKETSVKKTFGKNISTSSKNVIKSISMEEHDDIFSNIGEKSNSFVKKSKARANASLACQFCTRKFKDKTKLDFHISFKHPQMLEMTCEICSKFFHSAIEYQCHQLICGQENSE